MLLILPDILIWFFFQNMKMCLLVLWFLNNHCGQWRNMLLYKWHISLYVKIVLVWNVSTAYLITHVLILKQRGVNRTKENPGLCMNIYSYICGTIDECGVWSLRTLEAVNVHELCCSSSKIWYILYIAITIFTKGDIPQTQRAVTNVTFV